MNQSQHEPAVSAPSAPAGTAAAKSCAGFLSTLGDVGATWAAYGLKVGKMALETSADTLGKTAKALDTLAAELTKKAAVEKAGAEGAPVEGSAEVQAPKPAAGTVSDAPAA